MVTGSEINAVRQNANEVDEATTVFTDEIIESLVDQGGVDFASAVIWKRKAAKYSELVNVSEAGASRAYGDLYKNALRMAESFTVTDEAISIQTGNRHAVVHKIVRS